VFQLLLLFQFSRNSTDWAVPLNEHNSSNMSDRFDIAFGPGGCVCTDFADPRRLSSINLPPGLEKILKEWSAEKPDPYSDSESESESDTASPRRALSRSVSSSSESESEKRTRRLSVRITNVERETKEVETTQTTNGQREDNQKKESEASRSRKRSRRVSRDGGYPKISCLAFGSRLGEYAMVYYDEGRWYLGTFLNPFTHAIGCDD
jgi:hypothetical protein